MFPVNFFIDASRDVPAEGYIPRATYSPCRDGCAGCGRPLPLDDSATGTANGQTVKHIGAGAYHLKCYRLEKRAIRYTEGFLERVGLGRRYPKVS